MPRPTAVLFDFDGVIADSERLHHQTMVEVMGETGPETPWSFYRENLMGMDDRAAFAFLLKRSGVAATPEAVREKMAQKAVLFARYAAEGRVPVFPGAVRLIRSCMGRVPLGLCSGAVKSDIDPIVSALGLDEAFAVRITAEDVPQSKPHPASYQLCVEALAALFPQRDIRPGTCLAIEDSPDGIASAHAAGVPVLAVATNCTQEELRATPAFASVPSLDDMILESLQILVSDT
ncbi:MAG: HAD family phosphatase, partial [Verrucomicrobiota bacterium]|nr:HAD family phosphatase [Verrucomicrobiota bacterium]